jgi:hypothetical protein
METARQKRHSAMSDEEVLNSLPDTRRKCPIGPTNTILVGDFDRFPGKKREAFPDQSRTANQCA